MSHRTEGTAAPARVVQRVVGRPGRRLLPAGTVIVGPEPTAVPAEGSADMAPAAHPPLIPSQDAVPQWRCAASPLEVWYSAGAMRLLDGVLLTQAVGGALDQVMLPLRECSDAGDSFGPLSTRSRCKRAGIGREKCMSLVHSKWGSTVPVAGTRRSHRFGHRVATNC